MAYLDLTTPTVASDPGNGWTNDNNALSSTDTDAVASYPAGSGTDPLIITGFGPSFPARSTIVGFDVTCRVTRSAGAVVADETLNYQLTIDGSTGVGNTVTGSAISASGTFLTETIGGSTDMWGTSLETSDVDGNSDFGVILVRSGGTARTRLVDYVQMKVYYTVSPYTDGSLSTFPQALDDIPIMYNGTGPENIVRSSDVNLLADCLFNIETAVLASSGQIRSSGFPAGQTMYIFSITVTGTVTSGGIVYFERQSLIRNGTTEIDRTTKPNRLSNVRRTKQPYVTAACHFVSAAGWVLNGSTNFPVFVSPRASLFRQDDQYSAFICGFTAIGSSIATATTLYNHDEYAGAFSTLTNCPTGTLTVKMMCLGK